ncbi:3-deoxy-D-manno-octulosonic-acid transferase [Tranquillimonas rosea]|uniref:3-deoxy-D-manno-octulosonic acid transferase n=1 Tax=Tranquillimonas rosea TaxID=641238 RepID=A0A1H9UYE7_9RHOB|nr:glycosyltransferase N-terminal domain-containing protein [Tranquillimonas rosea]SES14378.1 3-deoxy-D-manno-octulosonic-acid transferase [Tranquillimonas rosea]
MSLDLTLPPPPSRRLRVAHWIYQAVLHLLLPAILAFLMWRSRREPLYRKNLHHRFGFGPVGACGSIWIHAASLGEVRAVAPLISELLRDGYSICLTSSSPAGLSEGRRLFTDEAVTHRYAPADMFWALRLFLRRLRPAAGLIVESEVWAGQLIVARAVGVPMLQVNGNLLDRTIERDSRRFGGVRLELFSQFTAILTKSETHFSRYLRVGVAPERIALTGELKFDQPMDACQRAAAQATRTRWSPERPVLLLASTVTGEEEDLVPLVRRALEVAQVVWVPRSPQRFDAVARRLSEAGLPVSRRSAALGADLSGVPTTQVLLGDSLGEMAYYYELSDLVFVGASLVDHGGHNIVEPLSLGKPVVMGPSIFGITFPAIEALEAGALTCTPDAHGLEILGLDLLKDREKLAAYSSRANDFATRHTGAAKRSASLVMELIAQRR